MGAWDEKAKQPLPDDLVGRVVAKTGLTPVQLERLLITEVTIHVPPRLLVDLLHADPREPNS